MSEATLHVLITSASAIIAAFGIPQLMKNWKEARELRYDKIVKKLTDANQKIEILEREVEQKGDELKERDLKISVLSPIIKTMNKDNPELIELMKLLDRETGVNTTPKL